MELRFFGVGDGFWGGVEGLFDMKLSNVIESLQWQRQCVGGCVWFTV